MSTPNTYSLPDLEEALRTCHRAVIKTRRGQGDPVLTLDELKADADALTGLVFRARSQPGARLSVVEIGALVPRVVYWQRRSSEPIPGRSDSLRPEKRKD